MSLDTYANLQTSVAGFLHRSDLASIIPDMITLAEVRINGDLDARLQDVKTTLTTTTNVESVALPSDLINIRHISVASTTPIQTLVYMTPDTIEKAYQWGQSGLPINYTVVGSSLYLAPIPDSAYTLDIVYKGRIPSLSASNTTNYLLTTYPSVYLYAILCEAAPYLKDDARIAVWETKYREAVDSVNTQDWFSGSTMMVKSGVKP